MKTIQNQARGLSRLLDSAFRIPGTDMRIGIDPLLGLIPGIGDFVGSGLSIYIIWLGVQAGAPVPVVLRMAANVALDTLFGAVPLLGDLFDAGWKANQRNVELIEEYLANPRGATSASYLFVVIVALLLLALVAGIAWVAVQVVQWIAGLF